MIACRGEMVGLENVVGVVNRDCAATKRPINPKKTTRDRDDRQTKCIYSIAAKNVPPKNDKSRAQEKKVIISDEGLPGKRVAIGVKNEEVCIYRGRSARGLQCDECEVIPSVLMRTRICQ